MSGYNCHHHKCSRQLPTAWLGPKRAISVRQTGLWIYNRRLITILSLFMVSMNGYRTSSRMEADHILAVLFYVMRRSRWMFLVGSIIARDQIRSETAARIAETMNRLVSWMTNSGFFLEPSSALIFRGLKSDSTGASTAFHPPSWLSISRHYGVLPAVSPSVSSLPIKAQHKLPHIPSSPSIRHGLTL